jgi:hypothetical protein
MRLKSGKFLAKTFILKKELIKHKDSNQYHLMPKKERKSWKKRFEELNMETNKIFEWDLFGFSLDQAIDLQKKGYTPKRAKRKRINNINDIGIALNFLYLLDNFDLEGDTEIWMAKKHNIWKDWEHNLSLSENFKDIKKTHTKFAIIKSNYDLEKIYNSFQKTDLKSPFLNNYLKEKGLLRDKLISGDIINFNETNIAFLIKKEGFKQIKVDR